MKFMSAANLVFVDTNVFLYSIAPDEAVKYALARQWLASLWDSASGRVSWQVINEFYSNAVKKARVPRIQARASADELVLWMPVDMSRGLVERAWHWEDKAHLSWWDALIIAAAERAECRWLLTEDLQHGQRFGSVHVVSPFRAKPEDLQLSAVRPN